LHEKELNLEGIDTLMLYGVNDSRLRKIKTYFPKLKIVARGEALRVAGDEQEIARFEDKLTHLIYHLEKYQNITEVQLEKLMTNEMPDHPLQIKSDEVIVYGPGGTHVKARTPNQRKLVEACNDNDMVFAIGPAGTGKTYTAVALAVRALKDKEVKRIILTRPAVEAGENLGFLPGDLKEKLDPYLQPLYDALMDMIPYEKLADYYEKGIIEVAPLAFMRGRTLDKAFVILDEAQNATLAQMKMFLTRMGRDAKFIITGDKTQIDLPPKQTSGLAKAVDMLRNLEGIAVIELTGDDVIRHKLVRRIIDAFEKMEEKDKGRG
jgi:phosphate starvation-inducible protein PhoH and related proteins